MGRTSNARERLMGAAYELIWNYSYGAVTIDAICDRARVKKGSFYYFFDSKSELAVAAIHLWWVKRKVVVAEIFRDDVLPLDRIRRYLDFVEQCQQVAFDENGRVLGCPIFTLGSEIFAQNEPLRELVGEILRWGCGTFEKAIRDAQALGEVEPGDPALKARALLGFYEGMLTSARIDNNMALIQNLSAKALEAIGARSVLATAA